MESGNYLSVPELKQVLRLTEYLSAGDYTEFGIDVTLSDSNGEQLGAIRLQNPGSQSDGYAWYPE